MNNNVNATCVTDASADRIKSGKRAGIVGISVNILLFILKLIAGLVSSSVSIVADAVNNLTDAASSILVVVGYAVSSKPADHEHPYGHARMEYICSLFISVIVTVLGIELLRSSVEAFFTDDGGASYTTLSLVIMLFSIAAKIALAFFYNTVGKKINSESLKASAADSVGDVCATGAVILGILLAPVIGKNADAIFGSLIAIYILVMGVKLIVESSNTLLGEAPDAKLVKEIIDKLNSYDGVIGIHDLVIHSYGVDKYYATVHLEMDADRDINESHDIIDNIEVDFRQQLGIQLVIHLDPVTLHNEKVNSLHAALREIIDEIAAEYSSPMSMHDFRVVFGVTHTNIIFDIAVSDNIMLSNSEIVDTIRERVAKKLGNGYNTVITIDRDYTTTRY